MPYILRMFLHELKTLLKDMFLPQKRTSCRHCGGGRCIGACQFDKRAALDERESVKAIRPEDAPASTEKPGTSA